MSLRIVILSAMVGVAAFTAHAIQVGTAAELEAAVANGESEIELTASEYAISATLQFQRKSVTVTGRSTNPRDTVIYGNGTFRIIDLNTGKVPSALFSNLTISNGYCVASGGSTSTAGVLGYNKQNTLSNVVVTCCTIDANGTSTGHGAGAAWCILQNCKVVGNKILTSKGHGGGVQSCTCYDTDVFDNETAGYGGGAYATSFHRSRIFNNLAKLGGGGAYGGSFHEKCVVSNNTAYTYGGGLYGGSVECKVYDSEICMNKLAAPSKQSNVYGGGISLCTLVSNCVIRGNAIADTNGSGGRVGGGVHNSTLHNCRIYDNFSINTAGGAMYLGSAYDCVFSNNCHSSASKMGAVMRSVQAERCTFHGDGADTNCRFVDCKFLNYMLTCSLAPGANVLTNGSFSTSGHLLTTIVDGSGARGMAVTNCLFVGNWSGSYMLEKASADVFNLVNCTFVDNHVNVTVRDRTNSETGTTVPFNIVNCAFPRNWNSNAGTPSRQDFKIEKSDIDRNIVIKNCLFGRYRTMTGVTLVTPEENCVNNVTDMMFDTSNAEHPYSLKRKSPAIGEGLYMNWMASATDLKGDPRAHGTSVAIGCYECWQLAPGFILFMR